MRLSRQNLAYNGLVALLSFLSPAVSASFASHPIRPVKTSTTHKSKNLKAFLPNPADFGDLSALHHVTQPFSLSTWTLVSNSAAAAADTAADQQSWWANYLQVFRNILVLVHTTVDGPLKNAGVENTWGISIALFTCGKFSSHFAIASILPSGAVSLYERGFVECAKHLPWT